MLSAVSIVIAIFGMNLVQAPMPDPKPPVPKPTRKPTNRPTPRPTSPTPPPGPFARLSLIRKGGNCGGGPGPCFPICDAACSSSNTSPYTCPGFTTDDYHINQKCKCVGCAYQC